MDAPDRPKTASRRWGRIALFLSLSVNLLVLGMLVGGALHDRREWDKVRDARLVRDLGLGPYLMALNEADRAALRDAAGAHRERLWEARTDMRRAFSDTLTALRADPFDAEILRALIVTQGGLAEQGRELGKQLLVERITAMTVTERAAFADRLAHRVHFKGPKRPQKADR